ncbi:hypothetical protein C8J56DRAFT_1032952 [Mycena floridula]|nr:hypothetical protein C8J56DRAFT_1032952 [Mycena floridula]
MNTPTRCRCSPLLAQAMFVAEAVGKHGMAGEEKKRIAENEEAKRCSARHKAVPRSQSVSPANRAAHVIQKAAIPLQNGLFPFSVLPSTSPWPTTDPSSLPFLKPNAESCDAFSLFDSLLTHDVEYHQDDQHPFNNPISVEQDDDS